VTAVLADADVAAVLVRHCPDPKFGDYQTNALMSLAKARKLNPRQLATDVVAKLDVSAVCEKVEIAGAGFLNFRLKPALLKETLEAAARGEHLFFEKVVGQASSLSSVCLVIGSGMKVFYQLDRQDACPTTLLNEPDREQNFLRRRD
jgi:arginyl-tRNA synthetase